MPRPSQSLRLDFRFFLTTSLAVIVVVSPFIYLLFERISSALVLRAEQSRLEKADLARSHRQLVPPPDPLAVRNCEALLSAIHDLRDLSKKSPNIVHGVRLARRTAPGFAAPAFLEPTPFLEDSKSSSSPVTWESLREQLSTAGSVLSESHKILSSPVAPKIVYDLRDKRFDFGQAQVLCAVLMTKSTLDLQEGRVSDAIENLEKIRTVATMLGQSREIVHSTLEFGIVSFAIIKPAWEILQSPRITEADLARLQRLLEREDFISSAIAAMEVELSQLPQLYQEAAGSTTSTALLQAADSLPGVFGNEILVNIRNQVWPSVWAQGDLARSLNSWHKSIRFSRNLAKSQNWEAQKRDLHTVQLDISNYDRWKFPIHTIVGGENSRGLLKAAIRIEVQLDLARAAVALARFQLANSRLPESLNELIPQYLPRLPHDWYDGQPIKYRRLDDGGYLLYSTGEDGEDNGGDASAPPGEKTQTFRGRDIVWPRAVAPETSGVEAENSRHSPNP